MKKILLIGNIGNGDVQADGQRVKTQLYYDLMIKEGADVSFVNLEGYKKHVLHVFLNIKKGIKNCDNIVLMAGPRGARFLLPYLVRQNKKLKKRLIYCAIGIGTLDQLVQNYSPEQLQLFLKNDDFQNLKDGKMKKCLSLCDEVVLQNALIEDCHKKFYGINNTIVLPNFRVIKERPNPYHLSDGNWLNLVYLARVNESKGVLDLMQAVSELNRDGACHHLDIYGPIERKDDRGVALDERLFKHYLGKEIEYKGICENFGVISLISHYDLFVFPTKFSGEGTPGVIAESFLAGVPVLSSNFAQASELIKDNFDGFLFHTASISDLKKRIIEITENKNMLPALSRNALLESKKYTYEGNRDLFIRIFCE